MRLAYLKLINYIGIFNGLGLTEIEIDFSKAVNPILVIKGDNGSGKSTIYKAMNPLKDSSIEFRPGQSVYKEIRYFLDDGSILNISYSSPVDPSGGWKTTKCYIKRIFPNSPAVELNPSGNVNSGKDIIYDLFSMDDNFMFLSQLSANYKGIGGLRPSDRKRYVNNIISSLEYFIDMNKTFSKKANTIKSILNSLITKLDQIGNIELLVDNLRQKEEYLAKFMNEQDYLLGETGKLSAQLEGLNVNGNIDSMKLQLTSATMDIDKQLSNLNPPKIEYDDKKYHDAVKQQSSLRGKIDLQTGIISDLQEKLQNFASLIRGYEVKLESLGDANLLSKIEASIVTKKQELKGYREAFKKRGYESYRNITVDYNTFSNILNSINTMIVNLVNEFTKDEIQKSMQEIKNINTTKKLISSLEEKREVYLSKLSVQNSMVKIAESFKSIPSDCPHSKDGNCIFIQNIVEAKNNILDEKEVERLTFNLNSINNSLDIARKESEMIIRLTLCKERVNSIIEFINSSINVLKQLPRWKKIIYMENIVNGNPIDLNLSELLDACNYMEKMQAYEDDIEALEHQRDSLTKNSSESMKVKFEYDKAISDSLETTSKFDTERAKLNQMKEEVSSLESLIELYEYAKEYDSIRTGLLEEKAKKSKELEEILEKSKQYDEINTTYKTRMAELNQIKYNEIPRLTKEVEECKYKNTMYSQYKKDIDEYQEMYRKIQILRTSTSINGIQSIYMSVFMNSILQLTNELLHLLFRGNFILQPFVINESEFRIPCIDIEGNLRPDISYMSDSQLSMISMIISFVLLHKASEAYNIIKLDEVDNNLDNENRLQFSILINKLMERLNFHQCVIISHNNEIDVSHSDMIVFKIENQATLNSLVNSGANIIFNYNK